MGYSAPRPYVPPQAFYQQPAAGYGAQGYGAPPPGYGAPPPGYGAPAPGYGAPAPGYGAPAPGYGAPAPGYGAPPPGQAPPGAWGAPPGQAGPPPGFGGAPPGAGGPPPAAADQGCGGVWAGGQQAKLQAQFQALDRDGSGRLDFAELATFFDQAGIGKQLVPVVLRVFDTEQVGALTFQQFWAYSQEAEKGQGDPRYLYWLLFQAIDANKSGYLELPEVIEFGTYLGYQLTDAQAIDIMKSVDTEQRGAVKFDEVCTAFYL